MWALAGGKGAGRVSGRLSGHFFFFSPPWHSWPSSRGGCSLRRTRRRLHPEESPSRIYQLFKLDSSVYINYFIHHWSAAKPKPKLCGANINISRRKSSPDSVRLGRVSEYVLQITLFLYVFAACPGLLVRVGPCQNLFGLLRDKSAAEFLLNFSRGMAEMNTNRYMV